MTYNRGQKNEAWRNENGSAKGGGNPRFVRIGQVLADRSNPNFVGVRRTGGSAGNRSAEQSDCVRTLYGGGFVGLSADDCRPVAADGAEAGWNLYRISQRGAAGGMGVRISGAVSSST